MKPASVHDNIETPQCFEIDDIDAFLISNAIIIRENQIVGLYIISRVAKIGDTLGELSQALGQKGPGEPTNLDKNLL